MIDYQDETEPTLVVKGDFSEYAESVDVLWELLVNLKEDCCAVYYPTLNEGYLFGPGADWWQPFDLTKMKGV
jgi:hypothetical protein